MRLQVRVEPGPPLQGDRDRIGQLLDNLLSNAVKFTESGGTVDLAVAPEGRGTAPGTSGWRVAIADTGIGIPEEDLALLFSRFFRGSNARTRGIPGRGLGLSIARVVAELHHGSIDVESVVGTGTTITVLVRGAAPAEASDASG